MKVQPELQVKPQEEGVMERNGAWQHLAGLEENLTGLGSEESQKGLSVKVQPRCSSEPSV